MRRFFSLAVVLLFTIPFGVSISGCSKHIVPTFCNGGDSGVTVGTATTITLLPKVFGYSLNYAEIGQIGNPSATDCKGLSASVGAYIYTTTDMTLADVQPNTGRLCGGSWNRNTGGGIADYTYCTPTNRSGTAYVTASADGVTSNPLPVFVHPVVTSVVLGSPTSNCTTDPTTNCCPLATADAVTAPPYAGNSCLSQGTTAQLVARVYSGTGASRTNISCLAGHLQFTAQNAGNSSAGSIVSIDQNGVVTAGQPGSALISANVSNAASSAGFFSTCPPASIILKAAGATTNPVPLNLNNSVPLVATVVDTNGVTLTGLSLEYVSTAPTIIPAGVGGTVQPSYAGAASISAICQPANCNPASYSQIGLFGNGEPITSNPVNITTPGTNSTVLYLASTQSQLLVPVDFTTSGPGSPFLLPYVPNSMVMSNDGSNIYLGSSSGLMVVNVLNTVSVVRTDAGTTGMVLAASPDGSTIVVTDPVRQTVSLQNASGGVITNFGGVVGTHAAWSADSQTVYITTGTVTSPATATTAAVIAPGPQVFVYSTFTGSTTTTNPVAASDVAVTVPAVGAFFAGPTTVARSYCPISTPTSTGGVVSESNVFYPLVVNPIPAATTDRIAATNDGLHILGATVATAQPTLSDLRVSVPLGACPPAGQSFPTVLAPPTVLSPPTGTLTATAITGVVPTSDSTEAFVTYLGTGGYLPAYAPVASAPGVATPGTVTYIKLSGTATAPIVGVVSVDNSTFYTGTSGDNLVHIINKSTLTDASTLAPNLRDAIGNIVPVNLMVQRPRKTT